MRHRSLALLGLSFLFSSGAVSADVTVIQGGDNAGLIAAIEAANADTENWQIILVEGDGDFVFTEGYQGTDVVLPELVGAKVALIIDDGSDAAFVFEAPAKKTHGRDGAVYSALNSGPGFTPLERTAILLMLVPASALPKVPTAGPPEKTEKRVRGFETVIQATGSIVVTANLSYEVFPGIYIDAEDSRIADMGSQGDPGNFCSPACLNSRNFGGIFDVPRDTVFMDLHDEIGASPEFSPAVRARVQQDIHRAYTQLERFDIFIENAYAATISNRGIQVEVAFEGKGNGALEAYIGRSVMADLSTTGGVVQPAALELVADAPEEFEVWLEHSALMHPATGPALDVDGARLHIDGMVITSSTGTRPQGLAWLDFRNSIMADAPEKGAQAGKTHDTVIACNLFDTFGPIMSLGYNIAPDDSCALIAEGDQPNTDPGLREPAAGSVVPRLVNGSPAIDGGPAQPLEKGGALALPCGLTDLRGLARPQDGNGDGTAECDVGVWEKQSGPDLTDAQSGAFFDTSRDGEGIFVEMLGGGLALVYVFTYRPDGSGQAWILGVGQVVGNSIVVEDMRLPSGATFGPDFDPDDVVRARWGGFAVNFPDCEGAAPGVMTFTGSEDLGYEPLITSASRITTILGCGDARNGFVSKTGIDSTYSGSWFDPSHNGEGIILEVINATTAVVQWFTFDSEGNQFWIQGVGTIEGKTLTVKEAIYTRGTGWGSGFSAADVERVPWGSITLVFDGCNAATMSYESGVAGFGSGELAMQRITTLAGLDCS